MDRREILANNKALCEAYLASDRELGDAMQLLVRGLCYHVENGLCALSQPNLNALVTVFPSLATGSEPGDYLDLAAGLSEWLATHRLVHATCVLINASLDLATRLSKTSE